MVGASERVSAAAAGRGGGRSAATAEAILRGSVSPVQEEDAVGAPQFGARPASRGTCRRPLASRGGKTRIVPVNFELVIGYP